MVKDGAALVKGWLTAPVFGRSGVTRFRRAQRPFWVDTVEKAENRTTPKILQMLILGLLRRCSLQYRYEGPWSFF
jgi:hypothetical protein